MKWKKTAGAVGYQVRYSTNKSFSKGIKTKKTKKTKATLKKLKKGRTYYLQVRPITRVVNRLTRESKDVYGKWSGKKKVKIKK